MSKSYWLKDEDQKGNFSNEKKDTFDPAKRYIGMRLQQGVPLLDRDWNELEDIRRYEEQMLRKWYIGNGTPDDGFRISAVDPAANNFKISAGRCLVNGFEAVNEPYHYAPLFSITDHELKVDEETIPNTLKERFKTENVQLSDKGTIKKVNENEWLITSNEDTYSIRKEKDTLNVYPVNFILYSQQKSVDNEILDLKPQKDRKDIVYLDVWIEEIGEDKDERLKNSDDVKVETCVRHKIVWLVRVDEESKGTYKKEPFHHYYDIAEITWNQDKDIKSNDIQDLRGKRSFHNLNVLPNGNVGIGTDDPQAKLEVSGGAIRPAAGDSENAGILFPKNPFGSGGDAAWIRYYRRGKTGENTTLEIGTSDNKQDHIALMASGNVGIGTDNPKAKLEVDGNIIAPFFKAGQGNSATVNTGKWYRIAENKADDKRANAEFTLRDYISYGGHSSLTFRIGISYNDAPGMSFTVLNHSRYLRTTFTKIRVLEKDTYDAQYLEVFVNRSGKVEYSIYDNLQDGGWDPVDWEEITTVPAEYKSREFDVDKLFVVGDNENRFTVDRGGNVCINVSSKELMDSDSIANLSVDEALNTIKDLKTKKFKYITDKDKMYIGFIAEEVPDLVKTDKTSLSVMNIISVLTSVVQSQQDEINKLQYVSPIFGCAENRVSRMLKVPLLRFTVLDTVVATVEVGEKPSSIAFDGTHIWVAYLDGNIVNKIDIKTHEKVATVEVRARQTSIAFDGKHIWVAHYTLTTKTGHVSKIDINTHKILATVEVEVKPTSIAFDGTHIWVADLYKQDLKKIDINTHEILQTVNVGQFFSTSIAFDGTHIWVALAALSDKKEGNVSKIDIKTHENVATVKVGVKPTSIAFDGTHIWVVNKNDNNVSKIDIKTHENVATVKVGVNPTSIAFDGTHIWVANREKEGSVSKIDIKTHENVATVKVGNQPKPGENNTSSIAFDGTHIWVVNINDNTVSKIRRIT